MPANSPPRAYHRPKSDRRGEERVRQCLRCHKTFLSTHKGNRLCLPCRRQDDARRSSMDA